MIIYFDTETTGLCPGKILQLSYIMEAAKTLTAKNFYFSVPYISAGATAVHGYTVDSISKLSEGKTFEHYADEIYDDFANAHLIVCHNFKFDLSFMIAEFDYLSRQFRYRESFDSMRYFTPILKLKRQSSNAYKFPKLSELCEYFDIYDYDISRAVKKNFLCYATRAHEARFDTSALFLAVKQARIKFTELNEYITKYI